LQSVDFVQLFQSVTNLIMFTSIGSCCTLHLKTVALSGVADDHDVILYSRSILYCWLDFTFRSFSSLLLGPIIIPT